MLCDELKVYVPQDGPYGLEPEEGGKLVEEETCYLKSEVDAAIAELKKKLMPCLNGDCILTCEVVEKYGKENAELKAKLDEKDKEIESLKASHYAESVDSGMRERRLKRALYKVCANWAWAEHVRYVDISDGSQGYKQVQERWEKMASKCIKKAREYR